MTVKSDNEYTNVEEVLKDLNVITISEQPLLSPPCSLWTPAHEAFAAASPKKTAVMITRNLLLPLETHPIHGSVVTLRNKNNFHALSSLDTAGRAMLQVHCYYQGHGKPLSFTHQCGPFQDYFPLRDVEEVVVEVAGGDRDTFCLCVSVVKILDPVCAAKMAVEDLAVRLGDRVLHFPGHPLPFHYS